MVNKLYSVYLSKEIKILSLKIIKKYKYSLLKIIKFTTFLSPVERLACKAIYKYY